jgi:hypothetical protein
MASPPTRVLGAQVPSNPFYETDLKHFVVWGDASLLLHLIFFPVILSVARLDPAILNTGVLRFKPGTAFFLFILTARRGLRFLKLNFNTFT